MFQVNDFHHVWDKLEVKHFTELQINRELKMAIQPIFVMLIIMYLSILIQLLVQVFYALASQVLSQMLFKCSGSNLLIAFVVECPCIVVINL